VVRYYLYNPVLNRMRLTLVIATLECGGAERVIATMANYWAAKGDAITVLTITGTPFYDLDPRVRHVRVGRATGPRDPVTRLVRSLIALRRAIRESRPDAVISFIDKTNVITLLAARGLGMPVIVSERGDPHTDALGAPWKLLRRWTYRHADHIVALNPHVLAYFPDRMRPRVSVIPNPVLPPPPSLAGDGDELRPPFIVAVGRLDVGKGFDLLLHSFAGVAGDHREWTVYILGDGPERPRLERLRDELGLRDRVFLPGRVRHPHVWLKRAALFVATSRLESFGNAMCEAMAAGLPVIATDCPFGPRGIVRDGDDAVLLPCEDVGAISAAMDRLMRDKAERERLGANARAITRRYDVDAVMATWERLVATLTVKTGRQPAA
jgi:GalNAc-alpha-(1->4)-GalNAc-alpha-(1->3)-diNAcBac-PP-undecaprenol alpha-1,4-N-acetyl-D-galactosaminyltransferase